MFNAAAPDLLSVLKNFTVTSQTVVAKRDQLVAFLTGTQSFANTAEGFLNDNGQRIINLAQVSAPTIALLDRYSPEYPCLLNGLARQEPLLQHVFTGGELHITLEVVVPRAPYHPGEEPKYADRSGPNCRGLPDPAIPAPPVKLDDGTSGSGQGLLSGILPSSGNLAGTKPEQQVVDAILAPVMGVSADQVPPVATLLFGPLARGTAVSVS